MSTADRIVFAGTPAFALPALDSLAAWQHPIAVYTQPDRPAGRGRKLLASPVKQRASELGIQVRQPGTLRSHMAVDALAELRPALMIVVAYGLILPPEILAVPKHGCINIHASLLPRWRGAAPIQRAIMAGDRQTGITIMQMSEGLDAGDVLLQKSSVITDTDTGGSLHDRLAPLGAEALMEALPAVLGGALKGVPQDASRVTYARKLDKEEALLDWRQPASVLALQVRAMNPWPVCECRYEGQRLRIWQARALETEQQAAPGDVVSADSAGIRVACAKGQLEITRLQLPGRRQVSAGEFLNANNILGRHFLGRGE